MAFNKTVKVDRVTVDSLKRLHVQTTVVIDEDGVEISKKSSTHVVVPGQDTTGQDAQVVAMATVLHTQAVIDAYAAYVASQQ